MYKKLYQLRIMKKNKKRQLTKDIKIQKRKQRGNMVVNVTKTSQKMKQRSLLTIDKNIIEQEKMFYEKK